MIKNTTPNIKGQVLASSLIALAAITSSILDNPDWMNLGISDRKILMTVFLKLCHKRIMQDAIRLIAPAVFESEEIKNYEEVVKTCIDILTNAETVHCNGDFTPFKVSYLSANFEGVFNEKIEEIDCRHMVNSFTSVPHCNDQVIPAADRKAYLEMHNQIIGPVLRDGKVLAEILISSAQSIKNINNPEREERFKERVEQNLKQLEKKGLFYQMCETLFNAMKLLISPLCGLVNILMSFVKCQMSCFAKNEPEKTTAPNIELSV